jgi:hypothetical protein
VSEELKAHGNCGACHWWWSWEAIGKNGYGRGECRRYPPAVVLLPLSIGGSTDRATPVTGAAYWCGEYTPSDSNGGGA